MTGCVKRFLRVAVAVLAVVAGHIGDVGDELIPDVVRHDAATEHARALGVEGPFAEIHFDFVLHEAGPDLPPDVVNRERASATA